MSGPRLSRAWLADTLRMPWAALWWNSRKSLYAWRGRRGDGPCHDLSDSGEPGRTRCMAVLDWNSPARFRRVCPLLVRTDHGWCCSVPPAQVRPFWGRWLGAVALVLLTLHLGGSAVVLVGLRQVGYPDLRYTDLVWPGNWDRVRLRQAEYFRRLGWDAWHRQDYAQALVALSSARQIEPADYETALFLAMLWSSAGNAAYGDMLFELLLKEFPDRADRTHVVYHDQLLAALRLGPLAELALERRLEAAPTGAAWDRSLGFAVRHGRLAGWLTESRPEEIAQLAAEPRRVIEALRLGEQGRLADATRWLAAARPAAGSELTHVIEALLTLNQTDMAAYLLDLNRGVVSGFEAAVLRYRITVAAGDRALAESDFLAVIKHPLMPDQADRAIAAVIEANDQASLRRLWGQLQRGLPAYGRPVLAAVWVAALRTGEPDIMREAAARWAGGGGGQLPRIDTLPPGGLRVILSTVELPRETVFALVAAEIKSRPTVPVREPGAG